MKPDRSRTDPYRVLEVDRGASADEIKRAYRRLALQVHPDRNPGDQEAEDRFKAINQAYEVLGDATRRRLFDLGLDARASPPGARRNGHPGWWPGGPFRPGGGSCRGRGRCGGGMGRGFGRGRFAETIRIDAAEAANGCERELRFRGASGVRGMRLRIPAGIEDGTFLRLATDDPDLGEILLRVQVV